MECVLKQLALCAIALADLLNLNKGGSFVWRMTEREVNASPGEGIFRTDDLRVVGWPVQSLKQPEYYPLRHGSFITILAGTDAVAHVFKVFLNAHGPAG